MVLAGGGAAGNAWGLGLIAGLSDAQVDVTGGDLIIGTSARSTVWLPRSLAGHSCGVREPGRRLMAPAGLLAREPPDVSCAAACPVPRSPQRQVLEDELGLHAGEQLLVNGASELPGPLVASAVLHGAQVSATAGSASRQRVAALGADYVIDYQDLTG